MMQVVSLPSRMQFTTQTCSIQALEPTWSVTLFKFLYSIFVGVIQYSKQYLLCKHKTVVSQSMHVITCHQHD